MAESNEDRKIYLRPAALELALGGGDYHGRAERVSEDPGAAALDGWACAALAAVRPERFAALPEGARAAARLEAEVFAGAAEPAAGEVPAGPPFLAAGANVILAGSPRGNPDLEASLRHWAGCPSPVSPAAAYFQLGAYAYEVDLEGDEGDPCLLALSEGDVHLVRGGGSALAAAGAVGPLDFLEVLLPVPGPRPAQGEEFGGAEYAAHQTVFLRAADVLSAPRPDAVFLEATAQELTDYGYFY